MYDIKALYEAESVSDAIRLRLAHPEAQIIAGGSDVLVQMREGKRAGKKLISIYMLDELRGVTMEEDETIAQVMPKVLFLNGSVQCLAKQLPTPMDLFSRFFLPGKLIEKRNSSFELRQSGYDKQMNVPYLSGCFMFFRISALQSEGLFDERFFMYLEDADITRRLHAKHKTLFFPSVSIYHRFSRLSYHNWRMSLVHIISVIKYFNKWGWFYDRGRRRFNKKLLRDLKNMEG